MHHKSALYAQDILKNNQNLDQSTLKKYLRPKYLGKAMLEVHETQKDAAVLQNLIEEYDCIKSTRMD